MIENIKNVIPLVVCTNINNEISININHKNILLVLNFLKKHINCQYSVLSCISGVDLLNNNYRFSVVYDLLSLVHNSRVKVKIHINEITPVKSIISVYKNANWWEREVWDMYGIYFQNHPDLRKILTDYGFEGYPLRKDFPLSGYIEVRYDQIKKRVIVEPLELSQEFRLFSYEIPW